MSHGFGLVCQTGENSGVASSARAGMVNTDRGIRNFCCQVHIHFYLRYETSSMRSIQGRPASARICRQDEWRRLGIIPVRSVDPNMPLVEDVARCTAMLPWVDSFSPLAGRENLVLLALISVLGVVQICCTRAWARSSGSVGIHCRRMRAKCSRTRVMVELCDAFLPF